MHNTYATHNSAIPWVPDAPKIISALRSAIREPSVEEQAAFFILPVVLEALNLRKESCRFNPSQLIRLPINLPITYFHFFENDEPISTHFH
jgi:hypothetical protein